MSKNKKSSINKWNFKNKLGLKLKPSTRALLDELVMMADDKGIVIKPQNYIAECCDISSRSVRTHTKILENTKICGLPLITVFRVRDKETGRYKVHRYIINFLAQPILFENKIDETLKSNLHIGLNELLGEYIEQYEKESTYKQVHRKDQPKYNKKEVSSILVNLDKFIKSLNLEPSKVIHILANIMDNIIENQTKIYHPEKLLKKCFMNYLKADEIENILTKFWYAFGFDKNKDMLYSKKWDKCFQ